ncbi:MAG TPA: NCS2 family permease, partial [Trueperaceae bacterium]|nr:NCS2 family permease [Trueperaceae bacterium]
GMGLNAFFTYTLVLAMGLSWQQALGAVFLSGIGCIIISLPGLNLREAIVRAVPAGVRLGVAAGIGLFLALIGMVNAGVIVSNPATVVGFGGFSATFVLFVIGLVVAGWLLIKKVRGALLIGILVASVLAMVFQALGWIENAVFYPTSVVALPSFDTFLAMDLRGVLTLAVLGPVFALLFTDLFDSISTFMAVTKVAGRQDKDGTPKNVGKALLADSVATMLSGPVGSSSATSYIESAAGVNAGGRSGLTAVVAGLLFLPFMFFSPLLGLVPAVATAPILVLVGLFMMAPLKDLDWSDYSTVIPAFVALIAIPFSYSITTGIVLGFIVHVLLKVLSGKANEVPVILWAVFVLSVVLLLI